MLRLLLLLTMCTVFMQAVKWPTCYDRRSSKYCLRVLNQQSASAQVYNSCDRDMTFRWSSCCVTCSKMSWLSCHHCKARKKDAKGRYREDASILLESFSDCKDQRNAELYCQKRAPGTPACEFVEALIYCKKTCGYCDRNNMNTLLGCHQGADCTTDDECNTGQFNGAGKCNPPKCDCSMCVSYQDQLCDSDLDCGGINGACQPQHGQCVCPDCPPPDEPCTTDQDCNGITGACVLQSQNETIPCDSEMHDNCTCAECRAGLSNCLQLNGTECDLNERKSGCIEMGGKCRVSVKRCTCGTVNSKTCLIEGTQCTASGSDCLGPEGAQCVDMETGTSCNGTSTNCTSCVESQPCAFGENTCGTGQCMHNGLTRKCRPFEQDCQCVCLGCQHGSACSLDSPLTCGGVSSACRGQCIFLV